MASDEAKRTILARRARFVTVAMASLTAAGIAATTCRPCLRMAAPHASGEDDAAGAQIGVVPPLSGDAGREGGH